jgi:hypothetical protein
MGRITNHCDAKPYALTPAKNPEFMDLDLSGIQVHEL